MEKTINILRKIVPPFMALLIATVVATSVSYAWFTMNFSVTVTGLSVDVATDSKFLQISVSPSSGYDERVEITPQGTDGKGLMLTTPLNVSPLTDYYPSADNYTVLTPAKFTAADNVIWGVASSSNFAQVQAENTPVLIPEAQLGEYLYKEDLYIKVADNSIDCDNLRLSNVMFNGGTNTVKEAARVLVVCGSNYMIYDAGETDPYKVITGDAFLALKVTRIPLTVSVFIYFDGKDDVSYQNNANDVSEVQVGLTFTVDD